jgi:formylglycine-generating enzyme required for sulfatase activity
MDDLRETLFTSYEKDGNARAYVALAEKLVAEGDLHGAATAYDRAYGLARYDARIMGARQELLDELAVTEHGIQFRYIPAGTFVMGSEDGDPDERPVHPVRVDHFWLSDTPISWARFSIGMEWEMPPHSVPRDFREQMERADKDEEYRLFSISNDNKIRRYYGRVKNEAPVINQSRIPIQSSPEEQIAITEYGDKPMVAVEWDMAVGFGENLSSEKVRYRLPTEAEWEKAARGGLIGATYAWGHALPTYQDCDFDHFGDFYIAPMRDRPPNSYGLYGMCGGVWEWTGDWYDAEYYGEIPIDNPTGPKTGEERVLRGGSWADSADVVTDSFRMSSKHGGSPTIGFRLCRVETK